MNKDYVLCEANGTKFLFVQAFVSDSVVKLNEQLPDDTDNECVERLAKLMQEQQQRSAERQHKGQGFGAKASHGKKVETLHATSLRRLARAVGAAAAGGGEHFGVGVEVLQHRAAAAHDTGQRVVGDEDVNLGFFTQALGQAEQQ